MINSQRESKMQKGTKELQNIQKTINKIKIVNLHLSIINSNVNGLNFPVKKYKVALWI